MQVDPSVHAAVYFVCSWYYKHMKNFSEFYRSALMYLAYTSSETLPFEFKLVCAKVLTHHSRALGLNLLFFVFEFCLISPFTLVGKVLVKDWLPVCWRVAFVRSSLPCHSSVLWFLIPELLHIVLESCISEVLYFSK